MKHKETMQDVINFAKKNQIVMTGDALVKLYVHLDRDNPEALLQQALLMQKQPKEELEKEVIE